MSERYRVDLNWGSFVVEDWEPAKYMDAPVEMCRIPVFVGLEEIANLNANMIADALNASAREQELRAALKDIRRRDVFAAEGHEGPYHDCPQCDATNSGDTTYHAKLEAWQEAADIARAALGSEPAKTGGTK